MAPGDSESPGASGAVRRVLSMVDSTVGSLARLLALAEEGEVEEGIAAAEGAVAVEELHGESEEAEKEVDAAEGEQEGKSPAVAAYTSRRMRWS